MGLNLEIIYNGECIANAYYHWGGYSYSALELLVQAGKAFRPGIKDKHEAVKLAVEMLESAGAKLWLDEVSVYKDLSSDFGTHEIASDESDGYISVSEIGMKDNRRFEEEKSSIIINRNNCFIDFECFFIEKAEDYDENIIKYFGENQNIYQWSDQLPELPFDPYELMTVEDAEKYLCDVDLDIDYITKGHEVVEMIR